MKQLRSNRWNDETSGGVLHVIVEEYKIVGECGYASDGEHDNYCMTNIVAWHAG